MGVVVIGQKNRSTENRSYLSERCHRLERENERLRRENEKLRSALRFLPPESFLAYYCLLVEAVYLTRQPESEIKPHRLRRQGVEIPVRNYQAYLMLRGVDGQLHRIKRRIMEFFNAE